MAWTVAVRRLADRVHGSLSGVELTTAVEARTEASASSMRMGTWTIAVSPQRSLKALGLYTGRGHETYVVTAQPHRHLHEVSS